MTARGDGRTEGDATSPPRARTWSDEAEALVRPRAVWRRLGEQPPAPSGWTMARRPLLLLLVLAGFVSFTSAGRLTAVHFVGTFVFWSFVPLTQILAIAAVRALWAPRWRLSQAVDVLMVGQGPWLVLLLTVSAVCLFAPDVYAAFVWLVTTRVLPVALVAVVMWSLWLTWAACRHGFQLSAGRATAAAGLYYAVYGGVIVGYYLATGQLQAVLTVPR